MTTCLWWWQQEYSHHSSRCQIRRVLQAIISSNSFLLLETKWCIEVSPPNNDFSWSYLLIKRNNNSPFSKWMNDIEMKHNWYDINLNKISFCLFNIIQSYFICKLLIYNISIWYLRKKIKKGRGRLERDSYSNSK